MSTRNIIQTTFDEFGKALDGSKKSGSWYITGPDAIAVLNLQKSQYGPRYYLNVGLWFGPSRTMEQDPALTAPAHVLGVKRPLIAD